MPDSPGVPRTYIIAALLLSLLMVAVDFTYHPGPTEEYNNNFYERGENEGFFPVFNASSDVFVVDVYPGIENDSVGRGELLAMSCLQGLVNRQRAEVYLDVEGGLHGADPCDRWGFFVENYRDAYELNITVISPGEFFAKYTGVARGVVIYDTGNEHTLNVAATLAGINQWLASDPDTAVWLNESYGLPIREDLRHGWDGSREEIYGKAFDRYYPSCSGDILFSNWPRPMGMDYAVACRGFVFCINPGPFTTSAEKALARRIMEETPADIPVIGWFEQPTGMEENYMIQLASGEGKIFTGDDRTPNRSFLCAYSPAGGYSNPVNSRIADANGSFPTSHGNVGDKLYISFAITDGDNLGFMNRRMRVLWDSPLRGNVPVAWSVSPLMAELTPSLLDYYYDTATKNDTFVCGPSGSGYFYPGFTSDAQRDRWLRRTKEGMDLLELRQIWLLNSFTTYETPYSEEILEDYVRALRPEGMMLDYGDVPEGRNMWMQGASQVSQDGNNGSSVGQTSDGSDLAAAPLIRSMHIWGDTDNFMAKLLVECAAIPEDEPVFAFAPVMAIDLDLEAIEDVLDELEEYADRLGRDYEIVSIDDFFYLMEQYYIQEAEERKDDLGGLSRLMGGSLVERGDAEFEKMNALEPAGGETAEENPNRHLRAYHAYRSMEYYQRAGDRAALFVSILAASVMILGAAWFLWRWTREGHGQEEKVSCSFRAFVNEGVVPKCRKLGTTMGDMDSVLPFLLMLTTIMMFFTATYSILYMNFWNYAFFGPALAAVFLLPVLSKIASGSTTCAKLTKYIPDCLRKSLYLPALVIIISAAALFFHPAAYVLIPAACISISGTAAARLKGMAPVSIATALAISISLGPVLMEYDFLPVSLLAIWMGFCVMSWTISHASSAARNDTHTQTDCSSGFPEPGLTEDSFPHPGLTERSFPYPKLTERSFPYPKLTAGFLSFLVVIRNMPCNRFLSIASGYRTGFLAASAVIIPYLSLISGYILFRFFLSRDDRRKGVLLAWISMTLLPLLLIMPFSFMSGRLAVFMVFWLFGTVVILGSLSTVDTVHRVRGGSAARFFRFLITFVTIALLVATIPPVTYTVFIKPIPIGLAYILYSLPLTILMLAGPGLLFPVRRFSKGRLTGK